MDIFFIVLIIRPQNYKYFLNGKIFLLIKNDLDGFNFPEVDSSKLIDFKMNVYASLLLFSCLSGRAGNILKRTIILLFVHVFN